MRNPRKLKIPNKGHRLVLDLFKIMNEQRFGVIDTTERAGIKMGTLYGWTRHNSPLLINVEAVGNVLGYELQWVKMK